MNSIANSIFSKSLILSILNNNHSLQHSHSSFCFVAIDRRIPQKWLRRENVFSAKNNEVKIENIRKSSNINMLSIFKKHIEAGAQLNRTEHFSSKYKILFQLKNIENLNF